MLGWSPLHTTSFQRPYPTPLLTLINRPPGINKKPSEDAIRKLEKGIIYLDAGAADNERKVVEKLRDVRELIMSSTAKRMSKQRRKSIMYAVDLRTKWAHKFASGDRIVIRSRRHHEYIYRSKSGRLSLCAEPDTAADVTWKFKWVNRKQRIMSLRLRCDRDAIVVDRETLFRLVKCGPYIALESLEHPGDYVSFMIGLDVYGILMYQCTTRDDERIHFEFEKV